ncbi:MAG: phosphotransferase [Clostridia bacterium]|nr:phosphotransferase [Clostridia bacterium]
MTINNSDIIMITEVVRMFNIDPTRTEIVPAFREEDNSEYGVWYVSIGSERYVLKKAKEYEQAVYTAFLSDISRAVPKCYGFVSYKGNGYFLMEYVKGNTLCQCSRDMLIKALDSLIFLQAMYWDNREKADIGFSFKKSLSGRILRGNCLKDEAMQNAFRLYLERYSAIPKTLCHDDLLPFNILVSEHEAILIDWEYAGILPYLSSIARLIAHG